MKLNDKFYNVLKWLCLLFLPALGTFVGSIFKIWNIPYATEIVTTINAIGIFIGAIIGISTINYYKGDK